MRRSPRSGRDALRPLTILLPTVLAALLTLSADAAATAPLGFCCTSSQSPTNVCGTCHAAKPAVSTTASGPAACTAYGAVWCPLLAAGARDYVASHEDNESSRGLRSSDRAATSTAGGSGTCCFWAPSGKDMCSSCTAAASAADWCGLSQSNCGSCGGKWCSAGGSTTAPVQTYQPTAATTTRAPAVTRTKARAATVATVASTTKATTKTIAATVATTKAPATGGSGGASTSGGGWVEGTYTTGYWDCCKPSCSWPGKGSMTAPVRACKPDGTTASPNDVSVCLGGVAGSCTNQQPWVLNDQTSLGFTAAAVSGSYGLSGDANCGQCYQLVFTDQVHADGNYGGSCPSLVGKSHIVQITNIGYDVSGSHTFDLQIPGAGQGAFTTGCTKQFGGKSGDYDCDNNYGGCNDISGCSRLPPALQAGCKWRYNWYGWLTINGQTNNPYVRFRRVRCPKQLTDISGAAPLDDASYPSVV